MSSFQRSFTAKQKARKRPVIKFNSSSSSSSEDESQDCKNIKKLSKLDAGLTVDVDKEYNYNTRPDNNDNGSLVCDDNRSPASVDNRSFTNDDNLSLTGDDNRSLTGDDNRSLVSNYYCGGNQSWSVDDNLSMDEDGGQYSDKQLNNDSNIDGSEDDDDCAPDDDLDDIPLITEPDKNRPEDSNSKLFNEIQRDYTDNFQLESTNREQSLVNISSPQCSTYKDFSDARRLPFIEKGVFCACQQLEENKAVLKEIKEISFETKVLIQSLMPIIKDLTVEVFDSKEEIKKRNGMFTDLLAPDVQLSIEGVKQFDDVIAALEKLKNVDNMVSQN